MNPTDYTPRKDPLIDAYRQANAHEDARASASVRAAVLAHARVVAQSIPSATAHTAALSETTRAATAANDPRPLWRLAAGVVIGLIGVWLFQLSRPASTPDATVATARVPQAQTDKARVAEAAGGTAVTAQASVAATAAAAPETTVLAAAPAPVVKRATADAGASPARADGADPRKPADPVRAESSLAIARAAPPVPKADTRAPAPGPGNVGATRSATVDGGAGEALQETQIASAEVRKSTKAANSPLPDRSAMASAAPRPSPVSPNAFPAQAAVRPAAAARAESQPLDDRDRALFKAVRAGDLPSLRSAIARGAHVNARDENGRTALQIAWERNDAAAVDALQAAGAR